MTAGELRALTVSGGLVWSASPVRLVTEDGRVLDVVEHRVTAPNRTRDDGVTVMAGVPTLTLVVREQPGSEQAVGHRLRKVLGEREPQVGGVPSGELVKSVR